MPLNLHFRLIPLASAPTVFRLQLLSSLRTFPFRAVQREREAAFRQFLREEDLDSISRPPVVHAYVPTYPSSELEGWTL
eukprot:3226027-Rhodomonas_salina.1